MSQNAVRISMTLACLLTLGVPCFASAADVRVSRTIAFSKSSSVRAAIKTECELQTLIPAALAESAAGVTLVDGGGNLHLEISNAYGPGGGVFSGPKWVEVTGRLSRGGKKYRFRAKRFSAADPFGGTCTILAKCGRSIARDIASWLENPTPDAKLGDAK